MIWILSILLVSAVSEGELSERLAFYQNIKSLDVKFSQTKTFHDMQISLKSKGRLQIFPPNSIVWTIDEPSYMSVKLNDSEIEIRTGEGKHQKVENHKIGRGSNANMQQLMIWLQLDPKQLLATYKIDARSQDSFSFVPLNKKNSPFKELQMNLDSQGHLRELEIHEKLGDRLQINFETPSVQKK